MDRNLAYSTSLTRISKLVVTYFNVPISCITYFGTGNPTHKANKLILHTHASPYSYMEIEGELNYKLVAISILNNLIRTDYSCS